MEQSHEESSQAQTLVFGFELEWSQSWGIIATPQPKFFSLTLALQNSTSHLCVCVCVCVCLSLPYKFSSQLHVTKCFCRVQNDLAMD
jgi:hypothetical protein